MANEPGTDAPFENRPLTPAIMATAAQELTASSGPIKAWINRSWAAWLGLPVAIRWFLVLGLVARSLRYLLRFPLWEDECFLCVNFIHRGYWELLKPLDYAQVAPQLFLWIELTATKLLGFNELSLRLFSFVCGLTSLWLFTRLVLKLLQGLPQLLAVAMFCVSYPGIRYSAEAKQYGADLLVGLALLSLAVEWWQAEDAATRRRWMWALTAFTPVALLLSLPALFGLGGASLFIGAMQLLEWRSAARVTSSESGSDSAIGWKGLVRSFRASPWFPWCCFNGLIVLGFGVLLVLANASPSTARMHLHWVATYPPIAEPWKLPLWFVNVHTGDVLAYPIGGGHGASTLTFLCVMTGIGTLIYRRNYSLTLLLLAAPALHLVAAALHRYPYGGHVKFSQHMAAAICLLASIGLATVIEGIGQLRWLGPQARQRAVWLTCAYFMVIAGASMTRDALVPYKTTSDLRARAFAEWFWPNAGFDAEVVCVKSDLGENFCPEMYRELSWVAMYECNRRIHAPRTAGSIADRLARVSDAHPLRCVVYRDPRYEFDQAAFDHWLDDMRTRYQLIATETFAFPRLGKSQDLRTVDYLDEYKFIPKTVAQAE